MSLDSFSVLSSLEEEKEEGKGYCSLSIDADSAALLCDIVCKAIAMIPIESSPVEPHSMHCTLMYDERDDDDIPLPSRPDKLIYDAKITGVCLLGKPGSDTAAIAIEMDCPELDKRFKQLIDEGFEHSFDKLIIHSTLVYGANESSLEVFQNLFDNGEFPEFIQLCNERWEELDD